MADAFRKNCDISIVVSADSDMIPAMELAMEESHPVFAYFPPFQRSSVIASMFTASSAWNATKADSATACCPTR